MADPVPAGSDVSSRHLPVFVLRVSSSAVQSSQHLPPCPTCGNGRWHTVSGGDSVDDPYPDS